MAQFFLVPFDVLVGLLGALVVLRGKLGFAGTPRVVRVLVAAALLLGQALLWLTPARYFLAPPLIAFGATPLPLLLAWGVRRALGALGRRAALVALGASVLGVLGLSFGVQRYIERHTADERLYADEFRQARRVVDAVNAQLAQRGRVPATLAELDPNEPYAPITYRSLPPARFVLSFPAPRYGASGRYVYDSQVRYFLPMVDGTPQAVKVVVTDLPWFLQGR